MVPMIRNILGGFLFSGDDVYKHVRVLSGGERTRLAVARMLLRPSNTLLLDEPTNHLDLDSKEVLLDALAAYAGTLIFVSHDRYFVERLATKIIEVGHGTAIVYPGTYAEFLWHKEHPLAPASTTQPATGRSGPRQHPSQAGRSGHAQGEAARSGGQGSHAVRPDRPERGSHKPAVQVESRQPSQAPQPSHPQQPSRDEKKRADNEARKRQRAELARRSQIERLESQIAEVENAIREVEQMMATPGFYDDRAAAQQVIDKHQNLMWKVGDLMHRWEELQSTDLAPTADSN
jgi:ATP-binding cassette, subfamily F, member 3